MSDWGKYNKGNERKELIARNTNSVLLVVKEKLDCDWEYREKF